MAPETLTVIEKLKPGDVFRWEQTGLIYVKVDHPRVQVGTNVRTQFARRLGSPTPRYFRIGAQVVFLKHIKGAV